MGEENGIHPRADDRGGELSEYRPPMRGYIIVA
jgi:hypothetical protein